METSTRNTEKKSSVFCELWRGPLPDPWMKQLKDAIRSMYHDSHSDLYLSEKGYTDRTWETIISAIHGNGEFWIALEGEKLLGFLIGGYSKEIENESTYVIHQAWVHPLIRRTDNVKKMLWKILRNAKSNFAKHVLIVSSRNVRAYLRWLGKGWIPVSTILKGDI